MIKEVEKLQEQFGTTNHLLSTEDVKEWRRHPVTIEFFKHAKYNYLNLLASVEDVPIDTAAIACASKDAGHRECIEWLLEWGLEEDE